MSVSKYIHNNCEFRENVDLIGAVTGNHDIIISMVILFWVFTDIIVFPVLESYCAYSDGNLIAIHYL